MTYPISDRMAPMRGSAIREIFKYAADPSVISLAGGNPAPELFPNEALGKIAEEMLREQPVLALQYGITEGYAPLRDAIRERLRRIENIGGADDELIVVSGGQQGIELTTKVLVNEGDTVLVEEPSFIGATNAFRSYGAHLVGVPVEEDGICVEALEQALKENRNIRFLYTIPTFQNPMGVTMSLKKRKAVYELAKRYGILILEDNPYGDLTFDGTKLPTIKSMDTEGIVLYSGSFSKILAPGLRLGFLCGNREILSKVVIAKQISDVHTAMLPQLLATEYMKRYDMEEAICGMRANYAHKCGTMLDAMAECFPASVSYTKPDGGMFIWCTLPEGRTALDFFYQAVERKVAVAPGDPFYVAPKAVRTFRLNYTNASPDEIREGIRRIGALL